MTWRTSKRSGTVSSADVRAVLPDADDASRDAHWRRVGRVARPVECPNSVGVGPTPHHTTIHEPRGIPAKGRDQVEVRVAAGGHVAALEREAVFVDRVVPP